jgi:hypothetical protein
MCVRLARDWNLLRRCINSGRRIDSEHRVFKLASALGERLGVRRAVRLLESSAIQVPTLIGWLRPTILLPVHFLIGLETEQIEAILAHEFAHIRRNDFLVNAIQVVIETFLYYHPVIGWISRRIREERENCCDDLAIWALGSRAVYGGALLALEEGRAGNFQLAANGGSLVKRIRRISRGPEREPRGLFLPVLAMVIILFGLFAYFSRADADTSTIEVQPLVPPVPELLTKPKLPRVFRLTITLKGSDLMNIVESPDELKDWDKAWASPKRREINLSCTVKEGEIANMRVGQDFPYPVAFDQPKSLNVHLHEPDSVIPAVIPMTPTEFKTTPVGWNVQMKANVTNGFINLQSDAFFTKAIFAKNVYGENTGPIYCSTEDSSGKKESALMSQNRGILPRFETSQTPFYLFAKPNKDYHVKLQQGNEWVDATIRVEIVP